MKKLVNTHPSRTQVAMILARGLLVLAVLILAARTHLCRGQSEERAHHKVYRVQVLDIAGHKHRGFLANWGDSTIYISPMSIEPNSGPLDQRPSRAFGLKQIQVMKIWNARTVLNSMAIGMLIGGVAGGILYNAANHDELVGPAPGIIIGIPLGGGVGALVGGIVKHAYHFDGDLEKFQNERNHFLNQLYR